MNKRTLLSALLTTALSASALSGCNNNNQNRYSEITPLLDTQHSIGKLAATSFLLDEDNKEISRGYHSIIPRQNEDGYVATFGSECFLLDSNGEKIEDSDCDFKSIDAYNRLQAIRNGNHNYFSQAALEDSSDCNQMLLKYAATMNPDLSFNHGEVEIEGNKFKKVKRGGLEYLVNNRETNDRETAQSLGFQNIEPTENGFNASMGTCEYKLNEFGQVIKMSD